MNRPWLRAGLIGAGILVVVNLLSLIPIIATCSWLIELAALAGVGALAAYYIPPRREGGPAAGQGALAGLVAGVIAGIVATILAPVSFATSGGTAAVLNSLPPETVQQLSQSGFDLATVVNAGTVATMTALCCLPGGLIVGAILGALGGLVYAAVKPE
jgi:hypothetical protein